MTSAAADWSVYDRPELRDSVSAMAGDGLREVLLGIDGMHCASCAASIERALAPLAAQVQIDVAARTAQLRFDPRQSSLSALLGAIEAAGFKPRVFAQDASLNRDRRAAREELARIGVAVLCAMQVMMLAWPTYGREASGIMAPMLALLRWTQWLLATPGVLYAGWPFFVHAARSLRARRVDMDVPIAVSLAIAYGVSAWRVLAGGGELYFDSATMFVMLLSGARWLEGRSRGVATGHLRRLLGARKLTATRVGAAGDETVALAQIARDDILRIAPGEAVPVDGRLLDDDAELDEALLSGEARPVQRHAGATLLAGSLNVGATAIRVRAEALGHDTWLAQITAVLNRAARERPPFQQTLDRIAGVFSLLILGLAALTAALWWPLSPEHALSAALAVLVASCPCALSLAGPLAFAAGSGRLARLGVLVARPRVLGRLAAVDTVIFDKTGTLTRMQPVVEDTELLGGARAGDSAARCLAIAAALERPFTHPIALAFRAYDRQLPVAALHSVAGRGISGRVEDVAYSIGADDGMLAPLADPAATAIVLRRDGRPLARFALRAPAREDAVAAVAALREQGCDVQLLTGDAEAPARALAQAVGIDHLRARMSPQGKLAHLRQLQGTGHVVMAVGDGINDAPLLAGADVACAMPQGAALAQAQADLLLVGDSLRPLTAAPALARVIRRRIVQNIAWALAYNAFVLPLAMGGVLLPWMAALGMSLSSLLVVLNALRLPRVEG
ncbi:heavy metal translocating P-type ATPase [Solimonas soli]|uniref:heavy metal translocating P-type ATPase n=1 Tax=Solimonas soli TaxID=413479 RepID=UPI0004AD8EF7|nr:cation-translocating P-type ATPase [Solimonas soli]